MLGVAGDGEHVAERGEIAEEFLREAVAAALQRLTVEVKGGSVPVLGGGGKGEREREGARDGGGVLVLQNSAKTTETSLTSEVVPFGLSGGPHSDE